MQTLVTGANGHLGFNLVKALLDGGHRVRAGVRSLSDPGKTGRLKALGDVELVEAELERPEQLRAAMDGVDVLFHAAAVYVVYVARGREQEILDASVKGAESALRAAANARVRKVVLTSSVVTLPFTAPGAPPSDVRDVVAAHVLAAEQDCEGRFAAINDTQPTLRAMLETMHAIDPKIPLPMMRIPRFMNRALPLFDRLNHAMLGTPQTTTGELVASLDGKVWNVSNRRARETLGWRPTITMEQSLRDTLETIRTNRHDGRA